MDLYKLTHAVCEAAKHWHLPLFVGLISSITPGSQVDPSGNISDLGDLGDNVPATLIKSLSSRRESL